jgi:hypothetical protein
MGERANFDLSHFGCDMLLAESRLKRDCGNEKRSYKEVILMGKLNLCITSSVAILVFSGLGYAEEITREGAEQLLQECQHQRQQHIAPFKEQAIEDCIDKGRGDREYCERYNRNFGEGRAGGTQRGMFWNLPECDAWWAANKYFKMNPSSRTYTLP